MRQIAATSPRLPRRDVLLTARSGRHGPFRRRPTSDVPGCRGYRPSRRLGARRQPSAGSGLTPADFTVLDNGVPQPISVFSAVDIPEAAPLSAPWMRDVAPDVGTNDPFQDRRLFLIIIDDATIQPDLQAQQNVRTISSHAIDRLGPSDLAAVIFTRDNRHSQDFTADRGRLLAASGKFTAGFREMGPGEITGGDDLYSCTP